MQCQYPKGFVAYLQGDVRHRMKRLARYLAKYVVSPPMALSRIVAYDPEHGTVTYWYWDHRRGGKRTEETVSRATFIGRMVQHILPKGFQRIRYYGLQATCILKQVREQLAVALAIVVQGVLDMVSAPLKQRAIASGCRRRWDAIRWCVRAVGGHVVVADLASAVWRDL
jgi:hypothetical protein